MGIEYYLFALFVALLVCIVAIVLKVLFSDVKRQNRLLDEREKKLLETYNAVETISEEFQDQAKATIDELKLREQEYREARQDMSVFRLPPELEKKEQAIERVPRANSEPLDANRIKAVSQVIENAEHLVVPAASVPIPSPTVPMFETTPIPEAKPAVFKSFFDDAAETPPPTTPYAPVQVGGGSVRDKILALADEGKTDVEIASQLGITRNEVQMVIGLTR